MNILYLCADHGIPVSGRLGSSTHVREFCRALNKAGHHTTLIATNPGDTPDEINDLDTYFIEPPKSKKLGYDLRNILHNRRFFKLALTIAKKQEYHAIYERNSLYAWAGTKLARKLQIPRILEINAYLSNEHAKKIHFKKLAKVVEKHTAKKAQAIAVVSEPLLKQTVQLGIDPNKIFIMPTAVNTETFSPNPQNRIQSRQKYNIQNRFVVGYVGGLAHWHGIDTLYKLAENTKNTHPHIAYLVIGGKPHEIEEHRQKVKKHQLQNIIIFAGSMPHHQVPIAMAAMDTAIIPDCLPWQCPTKLFEYQAMALPPIAPAHPANITNIQNNIDGILFQPNHTQAMLDAITQLADNQDKTKQMGIQARKRVKREHAWECNVQRTIERCRKLL